VYLSPFDGGVIGLLFTFRAGLTTCLTVQAVVTQDFDGDGLSRFEVKTPKGPIKVCARGFRSTKVWEGAVGPNVNIAAYGKLMVVWGLITS
jgi:hypothetical protein